MNSSYSEKDTSNSLDNSHCEKEGKKCSLLNLSTSTCEREPKKCSIVRKPITLNSECYNRRVAPTCLRKKCHRKCQNSHKNVRRHKHRSRNHERERRQHVNHKQNTNKLKSPIFSSLFKDDLDYLYEDISTDSFESTIKIPLSYKNVNNDYCTIRKESKLDTLIRRTKERERKLVEQSRTNPWYTMSPRSFSNVSSEECLYSGISDVSTFILERNENQDFEKLNGDKSQNLKTEEFPLISHPYSTSSLNDDFIKKYEYQIKEFKSEPIEKYEFGMGVKPEPKVNIGAYSPIPDFFPSISIKWEPKIDPNITWMDDGIAMTDYDD